MVFAGLEEFEEKVDKIANGQDDNTWIGQLYQQFSNSLGIDGSSIDDKDLGSQDWTNTSLFRTVFRSPRYPFLKDQARKLKS